MAVKQTAVIQGFNTGSQVLNLAPTPIVAKRDPTTRDQAELGTIWVNTVDESSWTLVSITANSSNWASTAGGASTVTSLVVDPGNLTVTNGNLAVTLGNLFVGGTSTLPQVAISTKLVASTSENISLTSAQNTPGCVTLQADAGTSETILIRSDLGTANNAINMSALAGGVTIAGGLATANAINLTASNASGGITATTGTAGITNTTANGPFIINTGTGNVNISTDNTSNTVDIATGTGVKHVAIGSSNSTSQTTISAGSNGISLTAAGNVAVTPATVTIAGTSATLNNRVGLVTLTGLTTAVAATEVITISNSIMNNDVAILVTVSNDGANDARMTLTRVDTITAGTMILNILNNGTGPLNGNLLITFWVLN